MSTLSYYKNRELRNQEQFCAAIISQFSILNFQFLISNQVLARHVSRLCQTHDVQDRRSHVGQYAVLHLSVLVRCHVDEGHGVQRVSRVVPWSAMMMTS